MINIVFSYSDFIHLKESGMCHDEDSYVFDLQLDMGILRDGVFKEERLINSGIHSKWIDFDNQSKELANIKLHAKEGYPLRIWLSNRIVDLCHLAFLCDELLEYNHSLTVVALPKTDIQDELIFHYLTWSEVNQERLFDLARIETVLTAVEKNNYSQQWQELLCAPLPLRTIINGQLLSVPMDFYDSWIESQIPLTFFPIGNIIGRLMGYQIGLSDSFYLSRIKTLIQNGKLIVEGNANSQNLKTKMRRKS